MGRSFKQICSFIKEGKDSQDIINMLSPAHLQEVNGQEQSLLVIAVIHRKYILAQHILDQEIKLEGCDNKGNTVLHWLCIRGYDTLVRKVLKICNKKSFLDQTTKLKQNALHLSLQNGFYRSATILLDNGANAKLVDKHGYSALHYAAQRNYHKLIPNLINNGADIDCQDRLQRTALCAAISKKNWDFVHKLLDVKPVISLRDQWGLTAIHLAIKKSNPSLVNRLMSMGDMSEVVSKKTERGDSAATYLVNQNKRSNNSLKTLLIHGKGINAENIYQRNALHMAAINKKHHCCRVLLSYNDSKNGQQRPDVDGLDKTGKSPLAYAAGSFDEIALQNLRMQIFAREQLQQFIDEHADDWLDPFFEIG